MTISNDQAAAFAARFDDLVANVEVAIKGKTHVVRLALTCLFTGGHLLLEDVPGTGKTVLAKSIANSLDCTSSRIQFTPDLLPSDVTGSNVYNQKTQEFDFRAGPVFHNILLADEINRASPKTQSALLEPMEENQATVDGHTYGLYRPFMVIATMNPVEQTGLYKLPEAQLDRFLIKTTLGAPEHRYAVQVLADAANRARDADVHPRMSADDVNQMIDLAASVHVHVSLLEWVNLIAEHTRESTDTDVGVSLRGCLSLVRAAKTWAAAQGRTYVKPDDVKHLVHSVFCHRIQLTADARFNQVTPEEVVGRALAAHAGVVAGVPEGVG